MKSKIRPISVVLSVLLSISLLSGCGTEAKSNTDTGKKVEKQFLTYGASPASSPYYPLCVAYAKAISTAYPEFQISVSESQGAVDITKRIRSGEMLVGNSTSSSDYENYYGTGAFKGNGNKDARILFYYDYSPVQFIVAKDANIRSLSDLNGKKFNPSGTGTSAAMLTMQMFEALGIKPSYFEAGMGDAADAVANRQIVGTTKAGAIPDSLVLQIGAALSIDLISMTDEEIQKSMKAIPYLVPAVIPKGTYKGIDRDIKSVQILQGTQTTTKLSQEDGYKMIKAVTEEAGRKVWTAAYPQGANSDLLKLSLLSRVPLHAGTVQLMKEKGIEVPKELIPPEYKEKQLV